MDSKEQIAIVGVGCKFPGANNLAEFWQVLSKGENHVKEVPSDRWNVDKIYDPDPNTPGKTYVRKAGFVDGIAEWDHRFFGINDMEAEFIDPQQRLVLDCTHMALENAGLRRQDIDGSNIGVYIGSMTDDYKGQIMNDSTISSNYSVTGTHNSIISARVSYVYNLTGPAVTLDTACSSSLVAIDIASQSIISEKCTMAICGGVNVLLDPQLFKALSRARMLSPTGQCQTFTADADGYARGEGCGIVILKSLRKAIKDGNKIWATIRTGSNQDGHMATPITAPSGHQQKQLIEQMYQYYKVEKSRVSVIEAHGTGTAIGDPTETDALGSHFGRIAGGEVHIGSVKTNIGHLEAAAGVAGLIKILLMMKHKTIVPSLFYTPDNENPKLKLSQLGFVVPTQCINWPGKLDNEPRVACVNSFGFGGTNAHAIVEQFLENNIQQTNKISQKSDFPYLVAVSALDRSSLLECVKSLHDSLKTEIYDLAALSCTSTCKRDHRPQRLAIFGKTQDDLVTSCTKALSADIKEIQHTDNKRLVFVFCGVGTTWQGMCTQLIDTEPFRKSFCEVDSYLKPLSGWSIVDKLRELSDVVSDPMVAHIAIFTCQVALAAFWKHAGVIPDIVIGQSVGEVAAAHVAGFIDLGTAVKIIYLRSKLLSSVTTGTMTVVRNVNVDVIESCCKTVGSVTVAVYSSPTSCTISGTEEQIKKVKAMLLENQSISPNVTDLDVKCAYHSPVVENAAKKLSAELKGLTGARGSIPMISTVTGLLETNGLFSNSEYWEKNVKMPVLFSTAVMQSISENAHNIFIEIGPSPVLRAHLGNILIRNEAYAIIPSMKKYDEIKTLMEGLCTLYSIGIEPNWSSICPCQNNATDVPVYCFRRNRHFYQNPTAVLEHQGITAPTVSHLYVKQVPRHEELASFLVEINEIRTPFVFQHEVSGSIIVPGATYADVGFEVARSVLGFSDKDTSVSLEFLRPVRVEKSTKSTLQVSITNQDKEILFHVKDKQVTMCKGWIPLEKQPVPAIRRLDVDCLKMSISNNESRILEENEMYGLLQSLGFQHGPCFRVMKRCHTNGTDCITEIDVPDQVMESAQATTIHPCILDGMMQSTINATTPELMAKMTLEKVSFLPIAIGRISVYSKPEKRMYAFTRRINTTVLETVFQIHYNVLLMDVEGVVIADLQNYTTYGKRKNMKPPCELNYHLTWHPLMLNYNLEERIPRILFMTNKLDVDLMSDIKEYESILICQNDGRQKKETFVAESFSKVETIRKSNTSDLAVVLYISNCSIGRDINQTMAMDIHSSVRENCMLLTETIMFMTNSGLAAPLFVVTQNTQPSFMLDPSNINLTGQELWGFARSVHMEFIHGDITLVDVQPSLKETKSTLIQFITNTYRNVKSLKPEIVIKCNVVYGAQFTKVPKMTIVPSLRADQRKGVKLKNRHKVLALQPDTIQTAFLSDIPQNSNDHLKGKSVLRVKDVTLHPLMVYPRTTSGILFDQEVWKENCGNGHSLFGIEFTGLMSVPPRRAGSSCRSPKVQTEDDDNFRNTWQTVALYPSQIWTEMAVPKECTVCLKDLPFYTPGLLLFSVLCWQITDHVPNKATVVIYGKDLKTIPNTLLKTMLCSRRKSHVIGAIAEEQNRSAADADILITLERLDSSFSMISRCKTIICLEDCLNESVRVRVSRSSGQKISSFKAMEVFSRQSVGKCLPAVVSWLQANYYKIKDQCPIDLANNNEDTSFPCKTITVIDEHNQTLPVRNQIQTVFKKSGIYIVTGGQTGLGLELVKLIAEMGAGAIACFSRRHCSPETNNVFRKIEKMTGCNIICLTGDVTDLNSVFMVMTEIQRFSRELTVRGVIHCAGVLDGRLLTTLDENSLETVLKPKVIGTMNMHIATRDMDLELFIVASSINSIIGSPGQHSYGAANSFLDVFMKWRRIKGLPGQAIDWGALSIGMASRPEFVDNFQKRGFNLLTVLEIRSCFQSALMCDSTSIIFADIDWDLCAKDYTSQHQARPRLQLAVLIEEAIVSSTVLSSGNSENILFDMQALQPIGEDGQREAIKRVVINLASKVTGGDGHAKLTLTLADMGFDSMSTVTFINVMHDVTGFRIPPAAMVNTTATLGDIVNLLFEKIFENVHSKVIPNINSTSELNPEDNSIPSDFISRL